MTPFYKQGVHQALEALGFKVASDDDDGQPFPGKSQTIPAEMLALSGYTPCALTRATRPIYFSEKGKRTGLAGGFEYSWTPRGKIVGRVGTGLNHDLKRDMLDHPEKYIGRVARVRAQGVYPDKSNPKRPGALRAPAFKDWHLDKNLGRVD